MNNNHLKYIIFTGLFIIPFVPLLVSGSLLFPFITGKAFAFRFIIEIIFASYLVLAVRDRSFRPKFSWVLGSILLFLVVIGVADFFAENPFKAFWSNYERMEGYIALLHFGAYFLVLSSVFKTQQIWNKLLATSLGASAIMAIYSFMQISGKLAINQGGVRVDGTLGNASYLGIYMVFHVFIAGLLFFRSKVKWQKIILGIVALMDIVVLYFTATRGAILGLIGGAFISFIYLALKSNKGDHIRKIASIGVLILIAIIGVFFLTKNSTYVKNNPVLSRFASLSFSEIKTQGRYFVWPMAIKGVEERPIFGWGQEGFNFVFNKYYDPKMYTQEPWFDRTHDIFLDWLVAGGVLGLLTYLSIFASLLYYIWKAKDDFLTKEDKAIILGLLSAYVFHNIFVFDQISSYILFFTILAYVHSHAPESAQSLWNKVSNKLSSVFEDKKSYPITESLIVILSIFVMYFGNYVPWQDNKALLNVLRFNSENKTGALEVYSRPFLNYGMGFSESLEHVSTAVSALASDQNVPADLKQKTFDLVDKAFQKQLERSPNDARYRLFYGLYLSHFGWYGRAVEQLKEAVKLSPNKQAIYFELASDLLLDNKVNEAVTVARQAYEILPENEEARMVYGLIALSAGQKDVSDQVLKDVDPNKLIFDDRYVTILYSIHDFNKIIEIAQKRISLDPTNPQNRITLTAAYLQAGRRVEAIGVLEEMIKLYPEFKEKGEYYISEIRAGRNP